MLISNRWLGAILLAILAVCLLAASPALAAQRGAITLSNGAKIDYYRSHALGTRNANLTAAVIVIHGTNRNAGDYAKYAERAAKNAGATRSTLIVVPQFGSSKRTGYVYWPEDDTDATDWQYCGVDRSRSFSSCAVLDEIVAKALDPAVFPNIKRVTVVGHSAGGQLVSRYAYATNSPWIAAIRFVPMNPGSWMFLNEARPVGGAWVVPDVATCRSYNRFRYGLEGVNAYVGRAAGGPERFAMRRVRILLGTADTGVDDDLDQTCAAKLQGPHRYGRGRNFDASVDRFWPSNVVAALDVAGVAHSASRMLDSPVGRAAVFGAW